MGKFLNLAKSASVKVKYHNHLEEPSISFFVGCWDFVQTGLNPGAVDSDSNVYRYLIKQRRFVWKISQVSQANGAKGTSIQQKFDY